MTDDPHDEQPLDVDLRHGDCLDVLRTLPANSVHAVITDPPYGLANTTPTQVADTITRWTRGDRAFVPAGAGFMGRSWDAFVPPPAVWDECLRVLKPGGHLLAFAGTRTVDLMGLSIRLAGFDVRDAVTWIYGSGFPKSLDVAAAIDKLDAVEERLERAREFQAWLSQHLTAQQVDGLTGTAMGYHLTTHPTQPIVATAALFDRLRPHLPAVPERIEQLVADRTVESVNYAARQVVDTRSVALHPGFGTTYGRPNGSRSYDVTAPHTPAAQQWHGWGTALKPASEPIVVARKPLQGTVAANVLAHGTGALNIDACRVGDEARVNAAASNKPGGASLNMSVLGMPQDVEGRETIGRWPANVVLDEHAAAALDEQSGTLTSGANPTRRSSDKFRTAYGDFTGQTEIEPARGADSGGASRFYPVFRYEAKAPSSERPVVDGVAHETVKPLDLMRWLVRLFAAPGSTILEPFAGSGTTVEAAVRERCRVIAVEREARYLPLIRARVERCTLPGLHVVDLPAPPTLTDTPATPGPRTRAAAATDQLDLFGDLT